MFSEIQNSKLNGPSPPQRVPSATFRTSLVLRLRPFGLSFIALSESELVRGLSRFTPEVSLCDGQAYVVMPQKIKWQRSLLHVLELASPPRWLLQFCFDYELPYSYDAGPCPTELILLPTSSNR